MNADKIFPAHEDAFCTLVDLRKQGRITHADEVVIRRALEMGGDRRAGIGKAVCADGELPVFADVSLDRIQALDGALSFGVMLRTIVDSEDVLVELSRQDAVRMAIFIIEQTVKPVVTPDDVKHSTIKAAGDLRNAFYGVDVQCDRDAAAASEDKVRPCFSEATRLVDQIAKMPPSEAARYLFDHYKISPDETKDAIVLALCAALTTARLRLRGAA